MKKNMRIEHHLQMLLELNIYDSFRYSGSAKYMKGILNFLLLTL